MFIAWFLVCSARLSFTLLIFSGDQQRSCEVNAFTFHCGSCRHVSGCILPTCQANYSQFKQCLSFHYVMSCWDQMRQVSPPDACCWREPSISCISFHVTDLRPSCESWRWNTQMHPGEARLYPTQTIMTSWLMSPSRKRLKLSSAMFSSCAPFSAFVLPLLPLPTGHLVFNLHGLLQFSLPLFICVHPNTSIEHFRGRCSGPESRWGGPVELSILTNYSLKTV